ncbi:hypothetical protein Salat_0467100 [Sesamum alatum]|uniref:Uncharacterized protein n=1 Tax=Sesamum alatum TaxID=300844 RepID=A0AAE1Z3R6_9LAMI|nr:hypothetical protein Salat_0467100 [Sesamum alatum]
MAVHNQLILDRRAHHDGVTSVAEIYIRRTVHVQMILPGDERPDFPPDSAVNSDVNHHRPRHLILVQGDGKVRRHRDGVAVQKGRPDGDVFVALIGGGELRREGDLLAVVGGVDVELVVVNTDSVVGVAGGEGHLEGGGEKVGRGDVEGVDGDVLEDEMGLGGAEDEPDEEDYEEDGDDEGQEGREEATVELSPFVLVVAAVLGRHVLAATATAAMVVVEVNGGEVSEK